MKHPKDDEVFHKETRLRILRRMLPASVQEIRAAYPNSYGGVDGQKRLERDLHALGAVQRRTNLKAHGNTIEVDWVIPEKEAEEEAKKKEPVGEIIEYVPGDKPPEMTLPIGPHPFGVEFEFIDRRWIRKEVEEAFLDWDIARRQLAHTAQFGGGTPEPIKAEILREEKIKIITDRLVRLFGL